MEDDKVVGIIDYRHPLTLFLLKFGEKKVLLTCDKTNEASRKTIIKNGGVLESEVPDLYEAISLLKEYRNYGIGTELMKMMKSILCFASCNPIQSTLLKKRCRKNRNLLEDKLYA